MVVFKIDGLGAFAGPSERDAIVSADADRPSLRFAVQGMEPVPCNVHLLRLARYFKRLQDADAFSEVLGANPPCLPREIKLFEALVPETGDHLPTVNETAYSVKPAADQPVLAHLMWTPGGAG
jgi:hypothetical protein